MWTEQDEALFQALIRKFKEAPTQEPVVTDTDLIKRLMEYYIHADRLLEREIYKKITDFYNIFFDAYLTSHPTIFNDCFECDAVLEKSLISANYPILIMLKNFLHNHPDVVPITSPESKAELKLEKEHDDVKNRRLTVLKNTSFLYDRPHPFYISNNLVQLYPNSFVPDFLSHPAFEKIMRLSFQKARKEKTAHYAKNYAIVELLGRIFTVKNPLFYGYITYPKVNGNEAGFILVSPDRKKTFYGKFTTNVVPEYFCLKLLGYLGIKTPEAQLMTDECGNQFLLTLDVSREYLKGVHYKIKKFSTLTDALRQSSDVAFNIFRREDVSLGEQEKRVGAFLEKCASSKEARISYAKILLVRLAFGLTDFGLHGGNLGLIETRKGSKTYDKFAIIDFAFFPHDITHVTAGPDFLKFIEIQAVSFVGPIFKKIYAMLLPEDMLAAANQLAYPKVRTGKTGMLFARSPVIHTDARSIINHTHKNMVKELKSHLSEDEYKSQMEEFNGQKDVMIKNLEFLTKNIIRILSPVSVSKEEKEFQLSL